MKKFIYIFFVLMFFTGYAQSNSIVGDTIYIPGIIKLGDKMLDGLTIDDNNTSSKGLFVYGGGGGGAMATFIRDVGATGAQISIHGASQYPTISYKWNSYIYSIGATTTNKFRIADHTNLGSNIRLELDENGDFDFQEGNITTTGDITANSVNGIYRKKVSLSSAQILDLHDTPIEAIAAPGAGKVIVIHQMTSKLTYGTATYAGASSALQLVDSSLNSLVENGILFSSSTTVRGGSAFSDKNMVENSAIDLYVPLGNPNTGDSTVDVYITYEIIEL